MIRASTTLLFVLLSSCATIASEGHGDANLPDTHDGPFRPLKRGQTCVTADQCTGVDELPPGTPDGIARYPAAPAARAPSALARGSGGDDLRVVLYVARDLDDDPDRIARMEAADGRTFTDVVDVLKAESGFEGLAMGNPFALDVDGSVWLYYSIAPVAGATGQTPGIARAVSTDGLDGRAFQKDGATITIDGEKGAWESDPPRAPSVYRADDGTFHLFYASGVSIGEATSKDGVHFTRVGVDPVLAPSAYVDPSTLPTGVRPPFDDMSVDDPLVTRALTVDGRVNVRLHYTGYDRRAGSWIGLAGRFGDTGAFEKDPGAVYGGKNAPHANSPAIARFPAFSLLFCDVDNDNAQAVGVGIAPAAVVLPIAE